MAAGSIPDRSTAARWAAPSRSAGWTPARPPFRRPSGVRTASTTTTSVSEVAAMPVMVSGSTLTPHGPPTLAFRRARNRARPGVDRLSGRRWIAEPPGGHDDDDERAGLSVHRRERGETHR